MSPGNDHLRAAFRALAAETADAAAPERVRRALENELRWRSRRRRLAAWWPAAAAAALILGVWLGRPGPARVTPPLAVVAAVDPAPVRPVAAPVAELAPETPRARLAATRTVTPQAAVTPWFFYTGLPPAARGQVVRIQVSSATAAQFGVFRGTGDVPAQVFIGDDGVARAIRFVR